MGTQRAAAWWEKSAYERLIKRRVYKFLGVPFFARRFRDTIWQVYSVSADDLPPLIDEMVAAEKLPVVNRESRVFEGGCSVGRNLKAIRESYNCSIEGADISPEAIHLARDRMLRSYDRCRVRVADLLNPSALSEYPNGFFDLVMTRWHLIHIASSPEKTAYGSELKRISKALLILEPAGFSGRSGMETHHDGAYVLSWDDWEKDYGLTEFLPSTAIQDTKVYFFRPL